MQVRTTARRTSFDRQVGAAAYWQGILIFIPESDPRTRRGSCGMLGSSGSGQLLPRGCPGRESLFERPGLQAGHQSADVRGEALRPSPGRAPPRLRRVAIQLRQHPLVARDMQPGLPAQLLRQLRPGKLMARITGKTKARNEAAIRAAMDRLLRGAPRGRANLKTLAAEAGVTCTGFYSKRNLGGTERPGPLPAPRGGIRAAAEGSPGGGQDCRSEGCPRSTGSRPRTRPCASACRAEWAD